jgi:ATP-dependent Clp protease ATP-binding subunit ClpA
MFERFTHAARDIVVSAQAQARGLGQAPVGTEHVLLAMLADENGAIAPALRDKGVDAAFVRAEIIRRVPRAAGAAEPPTDADAEDAAALKAIGIDLDAVRKAIEENFGPGSLRLPRDKTPPSRNPLRRLYGGGNHMPFSNRSKKVLELSLREAILLKHNFIAPEHLMLGILREGNGLAAQILAESDVDFAKLRADVTRSLRDRAA